MNRLLTPRNWNSLYTIPTSMLFTLRRLNHRTLIPCTIQSFDDSCKTIQYGSRNSFEPSFGPFSIYILEEVSALQILSLYCHLPLALQLNWACLQKDPVLWCQFDAHFCWQKPRFWKYHFWKIDYTFLRWLRHWWHLWPRWRFLTYCSICCCNLHSWLPFLL